MVVRALLLLSLVAGAACSQDTAQQKRSVPYVNDIQRYQFSYPTSWFLKRNGSSNVSVQNIKQEVVPLATPGVPTPNGSCFRVIAHADSSAHDIEEKIKSYLTLGALNKAAVEGRLSDVGYVRVGRLDIKAWDRKRQYGHYIDFVSNKRYFEIEMFSGSADQYNRDSTALNSMFSSFSLVE
jgi:hypothetical protein